MELVKTNKLELTVNYYDTNPAERFKSQSTIELIAVFNDEELIREKFNIEQKPLHPIESNALTELDNLFKKALEAKQRTNTGSEV